MTPWETHAYTSCELCPRHCHAKRLDGQAGFCGATADLRIARAALHFWEEPPISGERGSGAIFFSACPLRCVFCQNAHISQENFGEKISVSRLAQIMLELQAQGAHNINLVTPLHYAPSIKAAVLLAKEHGLTLPIVCNTSGYELVETLRELEGIVDIWLTDFKYADPQLAKTLSQAGNYPSVAEAALLEMARQLRAHGGEHIGQDLMMKQGIIVRHLVLPSHVNDSKAVLIKLWNLVENEISLSIMNQYTPNERMRKAGGALAHPLSPEAYEEVLDFADDLGFERIYWQQGGTVSESFVPKFDITGVIGPEIS